MVKRQQQAALVVAVIGVNVELIAVAFLASKWLGPPRPLVDAGMFWSAVAWSGAGALLCGILAAVFAQRREAPKTCFLLGCAFGPLGFLVAFAIDARWQCPRCKSRMAKHATMCPQCQAVLIWGHYSNVDQEYVQLAPSPQIGGLQSQS